MMRPTKRKPGRPKKPDVERKDDDIKIRLTNEQRAILDRAFGAGDVSSWARLLLMQAANVRLGFLPEQIELPDIKRAHNG